MTYSIVARDPATGQLGVAVQSCLLAAGSIVPWAQAGVGAVATQAAGEISYGPRLLDRLAAGDAPDTAMAAVVLADPLAPTRQVAVVDAAGRVATHTGTSTIVEAGHRSGDGWSVQANMMARPGVPEAMAEAFQAATGDLADRLLAALDAAQAAGGDFRGQQAAGLVVVGAQRTEQPAQGRLIDVRVDDHPQPLAELRRLVGLARGQQQLQAAMQLLSAGDAPGAAAALDTLRDVLGSTPERFVFHALVLLVQGDVAGARQEVDRFPGDAAMLREYFVRAGTAQGWYDAQAIAALFD